MKGKINWFCFAVGLLVVASTVSCGLADRHPDLFPKKEILLRQWTRPTRNHWDAGEKGAEYSNPVLRGHTLVFGSHGQGLISLYPGVNQVRWKFSGSRGISSEITVTENRVYFGGGDGYLYAIDYETGKLVWRYEVRVATLSKPTVEAGRLFVTTASNVVYAFDAGSGEWLWHYRRPVSSTATIRGASAPLVIGNQVIAGLSDGFVVALSVNDGKLLWERKLHMGTKFIDVDAHPVLSDGMIFVPSYDGALYALSEKGANTLWRFDAGGSRQVLLDEKSVFLPSSDGHMYSLQKDSGKEIWKFELDGGVPTAAVAAGEYLIFGSSAQYLYVLNKRTGKGVYRFSVGSDSGFTASPAYDPEHRRVYFISANGNLYSFSLTQVAASKSFPFRSSPFEFLVD